MRLRPAGIAARLPAYPAVAVPHTKDIASRTAALCFRMVFFIGNTSFGVLPPVAALVADIRFLPFSIAAGLKTFFEKTQKFFQAFFSFLRMLML